MFGCSACSGGGSESWSAGEGEGEGEGKGEGEGRSAPAGLGADDESLARKQRLAEFVRGVRGCERHAEALAAAMANDAWDITCVEMLTALSKEAVLRLLGEVGMGEGPRAAFLAAWKTEKAAVRTGRSCAARGAAFDPAVRALTLELQTSLQSSIAAGWDAGRFSEAFRLDQKSVEMIRRSAKSLIQSRGKVQRRIVERHNTDLLACSELLKDIRAFHGNAARFDQDSRQAVVLALLQRGAKHDARRDAQHAEQLSFVAVALMHSLLCDCTEYALRFLRDGAVVFLHQHKTVLTDDYHSALCAIAIGLDCDITSAPAVRRIIDALGPAKPDFAATHETPGPFGKKVKSATLKSGKHALFPTRAVVYNC